MPDEPTADPAGASRSGAPDPSTFRPRRRTTTHDRAKALHVCPSCDSELVYPFDWGPADRTRWRVDLCCPECEWIGGGVFSQELVDAFDEELDRGTEQLLDDLRLLARANMEDEVDRFVASLQANLIVPEDF
jgi:hypothetical protein